MHLQTIITISIVLFSSLVYAETITLYPSDDAYVDSSTPSTNYGKNAYSYVDNDAIQRTFLKWNINNLSDETIQKANVYLYALGHQFGAYTYLIPYRINNGLNWEESNITWNNQPSIGYEINYVCLEEPFDANNYGYCYVPENVPEGTEYIIDLTDFIKNQSLNKNYIISFSLGQGALDGTFWTRWASKENVNQNYWPKLVIEYTPSVTTTTSTSTTSTSTTKTSTTKTTTSSTIATTTTSTSTTVIQTTTTTVHTTTSSTTITIMQNTTTSLPVTTTSSSTTTTIDIGRIEHAIVIARNDFWEILFASSLGYPVLVWNGSNNFSVQQESAFIDNYKADSLILFDNISFFTSGKYSIKSKIIPPEYFKSISRGFVIVDGNRSNSIKASFIARMKNYTIIPLNLADGSEFSKDTICDFSYTACNKSISGYENLTDYMLNLSSSENISIDRIDIINSAKDESALASLISKTSVPLVFEIYENYTGTAEEMNSKNKIYDVIEKANDLSLKLVSMKLIYSNYSFGGDFFISLIAMPFGTVDDFWDDDFSISDGNFLFTDNLYYDINRDGYPESSVGRFCCSPDDVSIQLANRIIWKNNETRALILSEYRSPKYMDIFSVDGMTEGFATEWMLRSSGINSKRLVEMRLQKNISDDMLMKIKEWLNLDVIDIFSPEYWVKKSFQFLRMDELTDFKYSLLEKDWNDYGIEGPGSMDNLTMENFIEHRNYGNIIFYYGMGNKELWFLPTRPENDYIEPYHENLSISPEIFNFTYPKIIFDEHSLSGHPESIFLHHNNLVFIGSSGIVHNTFIGPPLGTFLTQITSGKSLGSALGKTKLALFENNVSESSYPTSFTVMKGLKLMKKESFEKILYGDPEIILLNGESHSPEKYVVSNSGQFFSINDELKIPFVNYTALNSSNYSYVLYSNASFYLYDCGKPIVPVFSKEFLIPSNGVLNRVEIMNSSFEINASPIILTCENYNYSTYYKEFPESNVWMDQQTLIDGRKRIIINFVPIRYVNISGVVKAIVYNSSFSINYGSPLEIIDFKTTDINFGQQENFMIRTKSDYTAKISILITGGGYSEMLTENISTGDRTTYINWTPKKTGSYIAKAVVESGTTLAGPRESAFSVEAWYSPIPFPSINFTGSNKLKINKSIGPEAYKNEVSSAFERASFHRDSSKDSFYYQTSEFSISIEKSPFSKRIVIKRGGIALSIISNTSTVEKSIKSPSGYFLFSITSGTETQVCRTNCNLMLNILTENENFLNSKLSEINARIASGNLPLETLD
jgi:hypothetical protein